MSSLGWTPINTWEYRDQEGKGAYANPYPRSGRTRTGTQPSPNSQYRRPLTPKWVMNWSRQCSSMCTQFTCKFIKGQIRIQQARWGLGFCMSKKLSKDAGAAGHRTRLWGKKMPGAGFTGEKYKAGTPSSPSYPLGSILVLFLPRHLRAFGLVPQEGIICPCLSAPCYPEPRCSLACRKLEPCLRSVCQTLGGVCL